MRKRPHEDTLTSETTVDISQRFKEMFSAKKPKTDAPKSAHVPPSGEAVAEGFTSTGAASRSEIAAVKHELTAAEAKLAAAKVELAAAKAKLTAAEAKLTTAKGSGDQNIIKRADDYVSIVQEEVATLSKSRNTAQARVDRLTESLTKIELELAARSAFSKYTKFVASAPTYARYHSCDLLRGLQKGQGLFREYQKARNQKGRCQDCHGSSARHVPCALGYAWICFSRKN